MGNLRSTPHILVNPAAREADQWEYSTILIGPASRDAKGLNYRWHSCVFTPFWDQFQSPCSYIKTFCCSPGPLIHLEKYVAEDCFKTAPPTSLGDSSQYCRSPAGQRNLLRAPHILVNPAAREADQWEYSTVGLLFNFLVAFEANQGVTLNDVECTTFTLFVTQKSKNVFVISFH